MLEIVRFARIRREKRALRVREQKPAYGCEREGYERHCCVMLW
jgi:hypothetical protein